MEHPDDNTKQHCVLNECLCGKRVLVLNGPASCTDMSPVKNVRGLTMQQRMSHNAIKKDEEIIWLSKLKQLLSSVLIWLQSVVIWKGDVTHW